MPATRLRLARFFVFQRQRESAASYDPQVKALSTCAPRAEFGEKLILEDNRATGYKGLRRVRPSVDPCRMCLSVRLRCIAGDCEPPAASCAAVNSKMIRCRSSPKDCRPSRRRFKMRGLGSNWLASSRGTETGRFLKPIAARGCTGDNVEIGDGVAVGGGFAVADGVAVGATVGLAIGVDVALSVGTGQPYPRRPSAFSRTLPLEAGP